MKINTTPDFYITEITRNTLKAYNSVIITTDVSKQRTGEKTVGIFFEPQPVKTPEPVLFDLEDVLQFYRDTVNVENHNGCVRLLPYTLFKEIETLVLKKNGLLPEDK